MTSCGEIKCNRLIKIFKKLEKIVSVATKLRYPTAKKFSKVQLVW